MHNLLDPVAVSRFLRRRDVQLVLLWLSGLVIGTLSAAMVDDTLVSLMRSVDFTRVSIFYHAAAAFLPFLLAAYFVSIGRPNLIFALCIFKSFAFAFCGKLIFDAYGSAGWLLRALLQFVDICTVPLLCWFCLRHVIRRQFTTNNDLIICALLTALVVCADYFIVSPILAELIDQSMGRYTYSCWI